MRDIKLYTTNFCPFCTQAKRLLQTLSLPFTEISLEGKDELRHKLSSDNEGWRTVPMIFLGEEFIGGFNELADLHRLGQLQDKLK